MTTEAAYDFSALRSVSQCLSSANSEISDNVVHTIRECADHHPVGQGASDPAVDSTLYLFNEMLTEAASETSALAEKLTDVSTNVKLSVDAMEEANADIAADQSRLESQISITPPRSDSTVSITSQYA